MTFFRSCKHQRLLWSLLLLSVGAAAGFGLGIFCGAEPPVGCRESDLTPVPDESFVSPASASSVETSPEPEPMPEKWVCLTFDDGPSKTTPDVLSALNAAGVHATFFVVATGYNEKYLPLIADAAAAGHQIALHSASHEYSDIYQSSAAYWQDIELLKERISPYVNTTALHYLRFPGGSTNTVSRRYGGRGVMAELKQQCAEKGYVYVDWNVCAEDAVGGKPSAGTIYRNVVRETSEQTQCIVLMHDSATTRTTAEALPDIIQWYKDNGFTFLTVEQAVPLPTA
jgi:peptidoglycan/xylan/chitin deacetylase (PgdA/CDA1 family)